MHYRVRAPGKLILSGEHAVLYGSPAIALAINKHIELGIKEDVPGQFDVAFKGFRRSARFDYVDLLQVKYEKTLKRPINLIQYAIILILDQLKLSREAIENLGFSLEISSDLPIGSGLGSSAALILVIMKGILGLLKAQPISDSVLLELARQAESLQHGQSSGLDLFIAWHGGFYKYQRPQIYEKLNPKTLHWPLLMIHTGKPQSNTGACVAVAKQHMQPSLLQAFERVTLAMQSAVEANDLQAFKAAIKTNHDLLIALQVIPDKVQRFIAVLNEMDIAAKVCGAGAVSGQAAGTVLALGSNWDLLYTVAEKYGYTVSPVSIDEEGIVVL